MFDLYCEQKFIRIAIIESNNLTVYGVLEEP